MLEKARVKLKRGSNEDAQSNRTFQRQNGTFADLDSETIRKTVPKLQILAQRAMQNGVYEMNETHGVSVKRYADLKAKTENHKCHLKVAEKSVIGFYNRTLYGKANAFTLSLTFPQFFHDVCETAKNGTILPCQWVWVYQESVTLLNMPRTAAIWSLGLLDLYYDGPLKIEIEPKNAISCRGMELEIGDNVTDHMIGQALGDMMRGLALKHLPYNTSHWCYMNKTYGTDSKLDNNFFSVSPVTQFVCCSYDLSKDFNMNVSCQNVHVYDSVWWDVPLGVGILMWLYFPLLFMKVNGKIHKVIMKSSIANVELDGHSVNGNVNSPVTVTGNAPNDNRHSIVFNDGKSPITAFSMVKSSLSKLLPRKQKSKSRMAIFVYSILTLIIPGIEVLVHYIYLLDYVQQLADNKVSLGFRPCSLAGINLRKQS